MKILIADDNQAERTLLQAVLRKAGHIVVAAEDGVAALAKLKRNKVDVIISDILMPRMDGYRFCYRVRRSKKLRQIPFIVYTATYISSKDEKVALIMGADLFVRKSIPPAAMVEIISKVASATRPAPPARMESPKELDVMRRYSEQLIAKLEDKNQELFRLTDELRASEERYRTLAETATDAIFVVKEDGTVEYVNSHGARQFALSPKEMIGKHQSDLFPAPVAEANLRVIQSVFKSGQPLHEEAKRPFANQEIWQSTWLVPIKNSSARVASVMGIARDITQAKVLEQQLRHSQKMEAVGQLAGGVAHDFNNILTVIKGYANFLLSRGNLDSEAAEHINEIFIAADRASKLTCQLLTFSRKRALKPQVLDLNQVLLHLAKMLQRVISEDIHLHFSYSPSLPAIKADASMMEQVVLNLAVNARDAMPRGGQLIISTESREIDEAYARRYAEARPGSYVCLVVRDTGCGIAPDIMPHVFEPFFTTKASGKSAAGGTGLGLATVYGIIKQHNGWIELSSQVGTGTTFKVFLPAEPQLIVAPTPEPVPLELSGGEETILIVEDQAELREVAAEILSRHGYRVFQAASGLQALSLWEDMEGEIDLVLTDLIMPDGLTGWELSRKLQRQKPDLCVIYTTGYSFDLVEHKLALPTDGQILQKPFSPEMLGKAVRDCLDSRQGNRISNGALPVFEEQMCEQSVPA